MFFKVLLVGFSLFRPGVARAPSIKIYIYIYNIIRLRRYIRKEGKETGRKGIYY